MKLLLVDLDDTLIDTAALKQELFQKIANHFGVPLPEIYKQYEIQKKGPIEGWLENFEALLSQKYNKPTGFLPSIVESSLQHLVIKKNSIDYLNNFDGYKVLFTYGDSKLQKEKIKILNIEKDLNFIIITSHNKLDHLSSLISGTRVTLNNREFTDVTVLEDKESILSEIRSKYPWIHTIHPDNLV